MRASVQPGHMAEPGGAGEAAAAEPSQAFFLPPAQALPVAPSRCQGFSVHDQVSVSSLVHPLDLADSLPVLGICHRTSKKHSPCFHGDTKTQVMAGVVEEEAEAGQVRRPS